MAGWDLVNDECKMCIPICTILKGLFKLTPLPLLVSRMYTFLHTFYSYYCSSYTLFFSRITQLCRLLGNAELLQIYLFLNVTLNPTVWFCLYLLSLRSEWIIKSWKLRITRHYIIWHPQDNDSKYGKAQRWAGTIHQPAIHILNIIYLKTSMIKLTKCVKYLR